VKLHKYVSRIFKEKTGGLKCHRHYWNNRGVFVKCDQSLCETCKTERVNVHVKQNVSCLFINAFSVE